MCRAKTTARERSAKRAKNSIHRRTELRFTESVNKNVVRFDVTVDFRLQLHEMKAF